MKSVVTKVWWNTFKSLNNEPKQLGIKFKFTQNNKLFPTKIYVGYGNLIGEKLITKIYGAKLIFEIQNLNKLKIKYFFLQI